MSGASKEGCQQSIDSQLFLDSRWDELWCWHCGMVSVVAFHHQEGGGRRKKEEAIAVLQRSTAPPMPKMTEISPQDDKKSGTMSKIVFYFQSQLMVRKLRLVSATIYNLLERQNGRFEGADQSPSELLRYPSPRVAHGF